MKSWRDDSTWIKFLLDIISRLKAEYDGQAFKNEEILESLNLSSESLPDEVKEQLETCVACCQILGIEDANKCNLMLKRTELILEGARVRDIVFEGKKQRIKLRKILKDFEELKDVLMRESEKSLNNCQLLQSKYQKNMGSISFLKQKLKDYETRAEELEESIKEVQPKPELMQVFKDGEAINSINEEVEALRNKLERFRKLPPNIELAAETVKRKQQELDDRVKDVDKLMEVYIRNH